VARIEPIATSTFSAWRETWGDDALFSDNAVCDLRSRIGSHHFYVVVTYSLNGQPLSCVFQNVAPREQSSKSAWFVGVDRNRRRQRAHFGPVGFNADRGCTSAGLIRLFQCREKSLAALQRHSLMLRSWPNGATVQQSTLTTIQFTGMLKM
jgi:hypothetical protein